MREKPRDELSDAPPTDRPLAGLSRGELDAALGRALLESAGAAGAHCVHELWMRGEISLNVERAIEALWARAPESIPDWLPMRYVERLAEVYEIALGCRPKAKGRSNIYLVLLDYEDSRGGPYGFYVGMTKYTPAQRFDQHKAGIRAAGSVLKRGLEVLTGPTLHLQYIARADAVRIEQDFANALASAGFLVKGGH